MNARVYLTLALRLASGMITVHIANFSFGVFRFSVGTLVWAFNFLVVASAKWIAAVDNTRFCFHLNDT